MSTQEIFIRAICRTLLHSLWQGLVLTLVTGLFLVITRKSAAAVRYNVLTGLLLAFSMTVGVTFYLQMQYVDVPTALHGNSTVVNNFSEQFVPALTLPGNGNSFQSLLSSIISYFDANASLVVFIWFCIFLARFVKIVSGLVSVQRIRHYGTSHVSDEWQERLAQLKSRLAITKPVLFLESTIVKIPLIIGWLKPVILVPVGMLANLTSAQVEAILLHELAHIRRRDYLINICQRILDTLFFFNPAVLWVSSLMRNERENCCDDMAIRETRSSKQYIEALVSFYRQMNTANLPALSFAAGNKHQLLDRVRRIIDKKNPTLQKGEAIILSGILLISATAFVGLNHADPRSSSIPPVQKVSITAKQLVSDRIQPEHKNTVIVTKIPAAKKLLLKDTVKPEVPAPVASLTSPLPSITEEDHGDVAKFRNQLIALGFTEPGDDIQLQEFLNHGLTPRYVANFLQAGYKELSLSKLVEMVDHGVTIDYIKGFRKMGFAPISLQEATDLIDHGVTHAFVSGLVKLGFRDITLNKVIDLQDHGVTLEFILRVKKKTGSLFTLDEYITLADSGVNFS